MNLSMCVKVWGTLSYWLVNKINGWFWEKFVKVWIKLFENLKTILEHFDKTLVKFNKFDISPIIDFHCRIRLRLFQILCKFPGFWGGGNVPPAVFPLLFTIICHSRRAVIYTPKMILMPLAQCPRHKTG